MDYPNSLQQLGQDLAEAQDTPLKHLARRIIESAKQYELQKLQSLPLSHHFGLLTRDFNNPPNYTDGAVLAADWADDKDHPLELHEQWNKGRRQTYTGKNYTFDKDGLPINPYFNTGMNGRGSLGQFGINHAVDNGVIVTMREDDNGIPTLYTLGILRKYDNDAPAFSGGFVKFTRSINGEYVLNKEAIIDSQADELFEEMISGSIELHPRYHDTLNQNIEQKLNQFKQKNNGVSASLDYQIEVKAQEETALKMQQVKDEDPAFLIRLRQIVSRGHECFAGPALNDPRTTNNAWIETKLSWFLLDDKIWNYIKGDNPKFDYDFVAGDDSSGIVYHRINGDLIDRAFASHGSMFSFLTASFLLKSQKEGIELPPSIIAQAEDLANYLEKSTKQINLKILSPSKCDFS